MSLNGLDATEVNLAYRSALAEAGGWFLLKYISRDEVDLLRAGTGGVVEVRDAISQYDAKSPLYGFVQYRRRKVILKFLPEGTSRLLQARVAVHFQSITDRFSPHDTVFSVTSPSDLKETAVSAACSLHTASASVSSSNSSLRRRRLQEIAEDGEDSQPVATARETSKHPEREDQRRDDVRDLGKPPAEQTAEDKEEQEKRIWRDEREALRAGAVRQGHVPATPTPSLHDDDGSDVTERNPDYLVKTIQQPRASSQSSRPTARDLYGEYVYQPKVKLGPRPSTETARRPYTSGGSRHTETRPISTLPAGIKIPSRRPMLSQPHSERSTSNLSITPIPSLPPKIPDLPVLNRIAIDSAMTEVAPVTIDQRPVHPTTKPSVVTPEKRRLMKALELRKKQLALAAASTKEELEAVNSPCTESEGGADGQRNAEIMQRISNQPTTNNINVTRSEVENDEDSGSPLHESSSPVSVLGPSEGPSTQASSFTDDSDHPAKEVENSDADIMISSNELESCRPSVAIRELDSDDTEHSCSSGQPLASKSPSDVPLPPATDEEDQILRQDETAPVSIISNASLHAFVGNLESAVNYVTNVMQNIGEHTADTRPSTAETSETQSPQRPNKRRGLIEPIRIVSSAENSDDNYMSDDSFMEELKSATVQEAKPVSVAKSPLTSMFPRSLQDRRPSDGETATRSISNPQQNGVLTHAARSAADILGHGYTRSFSTSSVDLARPPASSGLMAKKVNVSSGISRRIKALELVSSRETSPVTQQPLPTALSTSSPPFAEFRKASIPTPNGRSTSACRPESRVPNDVPYLSPSPSPHTFAPQNHRSSASPDSPPHAKQAKTQEKSRPGSISVTARILRGSNNRIPTVPADASEPVAQDLYQSPITIEHQGTMLPFSSYEPRKWSDIPSSPDARDEKAAIASASKLDGVASANLSPSRYKHETISTNNHTTIEEKGEEKKESRRSRLLKRMSSISSSSRRSLIQALSSTLKEEESTVEGERIVVSVPAVVDIGDVNVQFPDTLLWKRRHLMVDDQGYLILSLMKADVNSRSTTKRYHLSEFRNPYMPDQDRQELPNSVLLDFCDGTTLQLACENVSGQTKVLHTLKDAHAVYHQLYGQASP